MAIVEEGPFGGPFLNHGCITSKILIHYADVMQTIRGTEHFGIKANASGLDWQFIIRSSYEEIDADTENIEEGNRQADNITVYKSRSCFISPKTLEVNGEPFSGDTIVIAVATSFTIAGFHSSQVLGHPWDVYEPSDLLGVVQERITEHNRMVH